MGKLIISMHVSLDGFVAGTKGEMDWIGINDELFDYVGGITDTAQTALYGRKTWEMMDGYWPNAGEQPNASKHDKEHSAWYDKVNKIVLSRSMQGRDKEQTDFVDDITLGNAVDNAKQKGDIAVFGSPSAIHVLFAKDLVDEMYLFVNPVTLVSGIPLFKGIEGKGQWQLKESKVFESCGVVGSRYERKR